MGFEERGAYVNIVNELGAENENGLRHILHNFKVYRKRTYIERNGEWN